MLFKTFDVNVNWVQIDDDVIPRPAYISSGKWVEFWESCQEGKTWQEGYETGLEENEKQINALNDQIDDLETECAELRKDVVDAEEEAREECNRAEKEYERGYKDGLNDGRQGV